MLIKFILLAFPIYVMFSFFTLLNIYVKLVSAIARFVGPRATKNDSLGKTEKLCLSREIVALVLE